MMNCLSTQQKDHINTTISEYESLLIKKRILKSREPESYYQLYEKVAKGEVVDFSNAYEFTSKIRVTDTVANKKISKCFEQIVNTERFEKSKFKKIIELENRWGAAQMGDKERSPAWYSQNVIKILSIEDFELEYYRTYALTFIERFK
ncbi:hypothetical protein [Aquimarina pacifica]|uniref:hypothetical protein n=1 Tax=Aquimarina pacifica TaxID=1296415 RepID=UPI0004AC6892|nr:hypothetical protein [Aquimarina pacifica]